MWLRRAVFLKPQGWPMAAGLLPEALQIHRKASGKAERTLPAGTARTSRALERSWLYCTLAGSFLANCFISLSPSHSSVKWAKLFAVSASRECCEEQIMR